MPFIDSLKTFVRSLPEALAMGLIWGIMAIGLYISYKILDFADLTVDGSFCTGACVCVVLLINGVNVWVCILCATLAGAITGMITGLLHTAMGIPAILAGILTQLALWAINLKIGGATMTIPSIGKNVPVLLTSSKIYIAILVAALFCIAIIAILYIFFGTELGCSIRATGENENMSRAQGINVNLNKVIGLMISNAIVALSGALLAQYQGSSEINMGRGAIVVGLAAIVIGQTIVSKISRNFAVQLFGAVIGGIIYYVVYQFVFSMGIDADMLKLLSAVVVAIFLAIPFWKKKYFSRPKAKEKVPDTPDAPIVSEVTEEGSENA